MSEIKNTINTEEINKFSRLADEWWKAEGKFKTLHKFNPIRLKFIIDQTITIFKCDEKSDQPLKGIKILDIGCGGGLLSEPLARLGASVTGVDAAENNIKAATIHAQNENININYINGDIDSIEPLEKFDVILNMEVIEHVDNTDYFMKSCCSRANKNGIIFMATINRTLFSLLFAKYMAEYVLGFLPKGTHDWNKFLSPEEIYSFLLKNDFNVRETLGVNFNPIKNSWSISRSTPANFMVLGQKN
ncbi:bifunctional 2-polyprenyl-6-hydroxyphenol methylase/3-demethylubiquinol 3-O-methyltransferase UbiG [Pelagibacterales bacterium]|nr:bifunctional 2-polyprenyl-6-hydroxyphenol methylase/3-demethylubiquinol 3-O-methyltransferase UbiG [Pelagibacterales bacterium]